MAAVIIQAVVPVSKVTTSAAEASGARLNASSARVVLERDRINESEIIVSKLHTQEVDIRGLAEARRLRPCSLAVDTDLSPLAGETKKDAAHQGGGVG
jgi:hypothetical protein